MREDAGPRRAGINMHDLIDDAAPLRGVRHDKAGSAGITCEAVELLRKDRVILSPARLLRERFRQSFAKFGAIRVRQGTPKQSANERDDSIERAPHVARYRRRRRAQVRNRNLLRAASPEHRLEPNHGPDRTSNGSENQQPASGYSVFFSAHGPGPTRLLLNLRS
jgi:hypothetical protein